MLRNLYKTVVERVFSDVRWLRYLGGPNKAERFYVSRNNTTAVQREPHPKGSFFSPFSAKTTHQSYGGHNIAHLCAVYQGWRGGPCFCSVSCGRDADTLGFKIFLHQSHRRRKASVSCVLRERLSPPFRDEDLGFALGFAIVSRPLKWNKMRIYVKRSHPFRVSSIFDLCT